MRLSRFLSDIAGNVDSVRNVEHGTIALRIWLDGVRSAAVVVVVVCSFNASLTKLKKSFVDILSRLS